jgi:D-amino-acid oxidase
MKTAVIGGGIIGLTTALKLARAGKDVTVFSRDPIERTTSFAAGAVIYPVNIEESDRVLDWFSATNTELDAMMAAGTPGLSRVNWRKCSMLEKCPEPFWLARAGGGALKNIPYGNKSGIEAGLILVDVDAYYPYLLAEFKKLGNYKIQNIASFDDAPPEFKTIINCTGVYAGALTNDTDLHPARGQIVLVRNPGIHDFYSTFDSKNYIYPRRDLCVLGGSFDVGVWDIVPDSALTKNILEWASTLEPKFKNAEIVGVRVGLRPLRSLVRLEKEMLPSGRTLIHNYGHGGCGYTLSWGCAADVLALAEAS